jgi:ADP-ribose pyrophosphatase YjhB (NUDIX family)
MERKHRISAGAIVIKDNKVLLVRYKNSDGSSHLVGPGGGVLSNEGISQVVVREVREETGLEICPFSPYRILFVEDLILGRFRMVKVWSLCTLVGGELTHTQGAIDEKIIEAGWYRKDQLKNETVYPPVLLSYDWATFFKDGWETKYLELKDASF